MIEIKTSSIKDAGKGVFATENIEIGNIITEYVGKKISSEEFDKQYKENDVEMNYYTINYNDKLKIVGDMNSQDIKKCGQLINDAGTLKDPNKLDIDNAKEYILTAKKTNCEFIKSSLNDGLFIISTRDIKKGEELFVHYGYSYWFKPDNFDFSKDSELLDFINNMDDKYVDKLNKHLENL